MKGRLFPHSRVLLLTAALTMLILPACGGQDSGSADAGAPQAAVPGPQVERPANLLLVTIDTWRFDRLGFHSNRHVQTPHLDELARRSLVFSRAYSHNPVTLPAHVNILTGTTPLFHGISDNTGFVLEERFLTMAELLRTADLATAAFVGAFPLDSRFGLTQGFDHYDDNYGTHNQLEFFFVERRAEAVVAPTMEWIAGQQKGWFCWVHLFDPHQPYLPPAPFDQQYAADPYSGEVAYVDQQLGRLFDFLETRGDLRNTVILVTGDHGEALGERGEKTHSYYAYNNTIHVPLFMYIPGQEPGQFDGNVSHSDILPTVCDLFRIPLPDHLQGESLLRIAAAGKRSSPDIYFESMTAYLNRGWAPLKGFISGNRKFIDLPIPELYDLAADPGETTNLAEKSDLGPLKRALGRLRFRLKGDQASQRSQKLDADVQKKLRTLGYVSEAPATRKTNFTAADDLKTLLPLQNRMLDGLELYTQGDVSGALRLLNSVIEASPGFVLVYRRMATIYQETGRIDQAVETLRRGLRANPQNVNLMAKLGIMLAEAGESDEAAALLEAAIAQDDGDPETHNYLGVAYFRSGRVQEALQQYRMVLTLDRNYAPAYNNMGSVYLMRYQRNRNSDDLEQAMAAFNQALDIDPQLGSALNGRASARYFSGDRSGAIADWQTAIRVSPNFADPYFNVAIAYLQGGDRSQAAKYLRMLKQRQGARLPAGERQRLERLLREAGQ